MTACRRETVESWLSDTRLVADLPTVTRSPPSVISCRPDGLQISRWEGMSTAYWVGTPVEPRHTPAGVRTPWPTLVCRTAASRLPPETPRPPVAQPLRSN